MKITLQEFPDYEIDDSGQVYSKDKKVKAGRDGNSFRWRKGKPLRTFTDKHGQATVQLFKDGKKTTRYVRSLQQSVTSFEGTQADQAVLGPNSSINAPQSTQDLKSNKKGSKAKKRNRGHLRAKPKVMR